MVELNSFILALNAFKVIDISDKLNCEILPQEDIKLAWEKLFESGDEICIVKDNDRVYGYLDLYLDFEILNNNIKIIDLVRPIAPSQIVASTMSLLDLLPLFEKKYYFFVLSRNEITHIVSYNHLDKLPFKLCLFSLFMELETLMLKQLLNTNNTQKYLDYLSEGRLNKARDLCKQKSLVSINIC